MSFDTLADGSPFAFWDDATRYTRVYHVAQQHPDASDTNAGSLNAPFATIARAADVLTPGDKVIVHAGIYRECVQPRRGGTAPDRMIAYEAAPGESVVITAAEAWRPAARPSEGWTIGAPANGATVWMADLPADAFHAYNPFLARNAYEYLYVLGYLQDQAWTQRALLRRGMVFYRGVPLRQVSFARDLATTDGAFWVEEPGTRLHFRLAGDVEPAEDLEVTAREQTFAPAERGLGYVRVSGFNLTHAADGLPVPQRASLSTNGGHHWIIEDCRVTWANGCGISIGCGGWDASVPPVIGHHIVRRNHISHCGVCGIAGARGVYHTLIEDNVIEDIGHQNLERMYECAGIKFHFAENSLIRGNVIRRMRHACGLWLDVDNVNNRITDNVIADLTTIVGAILSEMNFARNLFDHNVVWDVRVPEDETEKPGIAGSALRCDCNESAVVVNNLFGQVSGETILFSLEQANRQQRRTGLCRANTALNNVLIQCPHRIHLGRREENVSDGNLFDAGQDDCSFRIRYPEPGTFQNLQGWQDYFGLDLHSTQAAITAQFDPETLTCTWRIAGGAPVCQPWPSLHGDTPPPHPGPFAETPWRQSVEGGVGRQQFPRRAAAVPGHPCAWGGGGKATPSLSRPGSRFVPDSGGGSG